MATVTIQRRKKLDGSTSYPVYYVDPLTGKKCYHATFRTLRDANLATHTLRDTIDKGSVPEVRRKARALTLDAIGALCERTWEERSAGQEIRPRTLEGYKNHLKGLLNFERTETAPDGSTGSFRVGSMRVAALAPEIVKSIRAAMAARISAVTANRRLFILKEVCARALKEGEIAKDPSAGIGYLSEKQHQRTAFLTPEALGALLKKAAIGRAGYLETAILLGAEHGASLQEITSLKWSDIDFSFDGDGSITFFRTKNSRRRSMRLMPRTREALLRWRERLRTGLEERGIPWNASFPVLCNWKGEPLASIKHAWERARAEAELGDFHFHDLRHTFCSSILMAGGDLKMACEMIGHADIKMTSRYAHLTQLAHTHMQNRLASYYGGASGRNP
jgi:integrase